MAPCDPTSLPFAAAQAVIDAIWSDMGLRYPPAVAPLSRQAFAPTTKFLVTSRGRATDLKLGDEIVPLLRVDDGPQQPRLSADGEIVFVE